MSEHVVVETRDAVVRIRLDRPDKKNALTLEMYAAMADALLAAGEDPAVRAVLLTAAGDAFTAGNDLGDFLQRPPTDESSPVLRFLDALIGSPKPVVAVVQGLAVGVGATLLLHCDLVYAGPGARFHLPFVGWGWCRRRAPACSCRSGWGRPAPRRCCCWGSRSGRRRPWRWGS
jgi:enoyl-CoA hydratase/carnithine racemase